MRGVYGPRRQPHRRHHRIIPACAGFTRRRCSSRPWRSDHPRMRGVYHSPHSCREVARGSSPHARGLRAPGLRGPGQRGIIPACAGFTTGTCQPPRPHWDHPRMRGVYPVFGCLSLRVSGSSPHARGLPDRQGDGRGDSRIIPACAGFTRERRRSSRHRRDHPRMRGVYGVETLDALLDLGSSPHARGLPETEGCWA